MALTTMTQHPARAIHVTFEQKEQEERKKERNKQNRQETNERKKEKKRALMNCFKKIYKLVTPKIDELKLVRNFPFRPSNRLFLFFFSFFSSSDFVSQSSFLFRRFARLALECGIITHYTMQQLEFECTNVQKIENRDDC